MTVQINVEKEKGEIAERRVESLELEISKVRKFFTVKLREVESKHKEVEKERSKYKKTADDQGEMIMNLKDSMKEIERSSNDLRARVKSLKEEREGAKAMMAQKDTIEDQRKEIVTLKEEKRMMKIKLDKWDKMCSLFWNEDPKQALNPEKEYTVEDKKNFMVKLEEMLRNLRIEVEAEEGTNKENEMSMMEDSTLTDSGIRGSFSSTGALGDCDTLDLTTGSPKHKLSPASKRRKVDTKQAIPEVTTSTELSVVFDEDKQKPSKGNHRRGSKNPMVPTQAPMQLCPPSPHKRAMDKEESDESQLVHNDQAKQLELDQIVEMGNLVNQGETLQKNLGGKLDNFSKEFQDFKELVRDYMKKVRGEAVGNDTPPPSSAPVSMPTQATPQPIQDPLQPIQAPPYLHRISPPSPHRQAPNPNRLIFYPYRISPCPFRISPCPYRPLISPYRQSLSPFRLTLSPYRHLLSPYRQMSYQHNPYR